MNSETPNGEGTGYRISPGEATEIRRLFEEVQKHVAQLHRQNMIKRMKYGKAAKKAQREQQQ
jgi:16S rRNA U516 pseudouridylate synthase RsuA-like enzyme